ncbi:TPA: hypothetical protein U1W00_001121 [Streptococcus suis]|uniref:hypothetical protein n=1 Tax=Streptococcus suis TaxID=1307 RepID=UPI000428B521|nr:hypothetical protein [Streptococcus suis]MBY5010878.1 hypothetical protein [Streptococcus suis]MDG4509622.1 hypothetical protein [Streptococcus suis]MDG4517985.1 hypothetical protein [Streptococcus suis]NQM40330.1 hypothetical protein [Streptococcus suis]HEM3174404.1 hypothetical protein [Streptococcus suis]
MDVDRTANDLIEYLGKFTDGKKYVQILEKYRQSLKDGSQIQFSEDDLYWISFLKKRLEKKAEVEKFRNYCRKEDNKRMVNFLELVKHMETTCKV